MVEKPPAFIYASYPPQWDSVMWCACGYAENRGRVRGQTQEQMLHEQWKRANKQVEGAEGCLQPKAPSRTEGSAT
jgi:hypothetical protein